MDRKVQEYLASPKMWTTTATEMHEASQEITINPLDPHLSPFLRLKSHNPMGLISIVQWDYLKLC
jgi:hypothetical protein